MRVLIFDRGTATHYTVGLAMGLRRAGAEVLIAGPPNSSEPYVVPVYPRAMVAGHSTAKAVEALKGAVNWWRLVRRWRPDVLHFQWSRLPNYAMARMSSRLIGAPVVLTVHNPVSRGEPWQSEMVLAADSLIVHGPTLREELLERWAVPASRTHVIPHGNHDHAITRYDRTEARRRVGLPLTGPVYAFVGGLSSRKGVDTLAEAFRLHCERGHPGQLVLAGPVGYGFDLEALRRSLIPVSERVHWMTGSGHLPAEQLDLVTSAATQVVLPFHEASQSGSVIYAMTHGRCVVTTPLGELPATVGRPGLLIPPGDTQALAGRSRSRSEMPTHAIASDVRHASSSCRSSTGGASLR